jgi:large subunit ribosomal protein L10
MANPKPSGFSNTKAGKTAILERTKALLDASSIVLAVPFEGVDVEKVDALRKQLKKSGAKASVIKNSLIRKAAEGTKFEAIGEKLKQENIFIFIPEGESKPAYEELKKWQKLNHQQRRPPQPRLPRL